MGELTSARHEMFCRYYVLEPNGAKAARLGRIFRSRRQGPGLGGP